MHFEEIPSLLRHLEDSGFDMDEFEDCLNHHILELYESERRAHLRIDTAQGLIVYVEIQNRIDQAKKLLDLFTKER